MANFIATRQTKYEFFNEALKQLKNKVCGHTDMRDTQLYYMSHKMQAPRDMPPRDFYFRFKEIMSVALKLSGHFQLPNEHEEKTMLFSAFPSDWKEKLQETGMTIENKSADEITDYF